MKAVKKKEAELGITFQALIDSGRSCQSGGFKVTLDMDELSLTQFSQLLALKGSLLQVAVLPIDAG